MKDQSPLPSAVVVPMEEPSEKSSTVLSASAVPVKVGVASFVISVSYTHLTLPTTPYV